MGCVNAKLLIDKCIMPSEESVSAVPQNKDVIVAKYHKKENNINNNNIEGTSKNNTTFNDFFTNNNVNQSPSLYNDILLQEGQNTDKEKVQVPNNNTHNNVSNVVNVNNNNNSHTNDEHKSKQTTLDNLNMNNNNNNNNNISHYTKINIQPPMTSSIVDNPNINNNNNNEKQIEYPKVIFKFYNNNQSDLLEQISLTPNSLTKSDGSILIQPKHHKFSFGNSKDSDCELNDTNLAPRQFFVYFDSDSKKFSAIDNISGTGLFVKIEDNIIINHDMIVSFCADHMYLQVVEGEVGGGKTINIKFLQSLNRKESHFNSNQKTVLTIGRGNKCDIVHNGESVSKVHCTIKYEKNEWVLYDGVVNEKEQKKSTNGLWLLANVGMELKDKMVMKTGIYKIVVEVKEIECN